MKIITCNTINDGLDGGLGNQLFNVATTLAIAWDNNIEPIFRYKKRNNNRYNDYTNNILRNIKFNIGLFALLAIFSIVGTLVPQTPETPEKVETFIANSPKLGALFSKIELFNVYHSWWFIGLLGLLAFDVVVCKLIFGKFPGFKTFKEPELKPIAFTAQPFQTEWNANASVNDCSQSISGHLKHAGYSVKNIEISSNIGIVSS